MVRLFNFFSKINYNNFYKKFYLFIYKYIILLGKIYNSLIKTKNLMD
jgi:hypothetical protein